MRRASLVVLLFGFFGACLGLPGCTDRFLFLGKTAPSIDLTAQKHYQRAETLHAAREYARASAEIQKAIELEPWFVRAHRLFQEIENQRLRKGALLERYGKLLQDHPDRPEPYYLYGRLSSEPDGQRPFFELAVETDPDFAWGHYGLGILALLGGDTYGALESLTRAGERAPGTPEVLVALAQAHIRQGSFDTALAVIGRGRSDHPNDPRFPLALFALYGERGEYREAFQAILSALRTDPVRATTYQGLLTFLAERADDVHTNDLAETLGEVGETLRTLSAQGTYEIPALVRAYWHVAAAESSARLGQWESAVIRYREALRGGVSLADLGHRLRRALFHARMYAQGLGVFESMQSQGLLDHPANELRESVVELRAAVIAMTEQQDGERALRLARACRRMGWLEEAVALSAISDLLEPGQTEGRALRRQIRAFERFLDGTRTQVLKGYREDRSAALARVVEECERRGAQILEVDSIGASRIEEFSLFAKRVDPTTFDRGLPRLFGHFGRFAMVGQLLLSPVEFYVMRHVHVRPVEGRILGRPFKGVSVIGEGREIPARAEMQGGGIAGAAVFQGYFLNLDVVRRWARDLQDISTRLTAEERRALLDAPLPVCHKSKRTSLHEPLHVGEKLFLRALEREPLGEHDAALLQRLLEIVAVHERSHLADAHDFIPLGKNLFRVAGFLFGELFSSFQIQARLEYRAELAALATARESDLVLAHIVGYARLGVRSTHAVGFKRILRHFVDHLEEHLDEFPALVPDRALVQQLHRLTREEIRRVGLALAREEGLVRGF